jgi:hypothetical protein
VVLVDGVAGHVEDDLVSVLVGVGLDDVERDDTSAELGDRGGDRSDVAGVVEGDAQGDRERGAGSVQRDASRALPALGARELGGLTGRCRRRRG